MVFEDAYVMPFVNCFVMMMKMKMRETRDFGPLVCLVHPRGVGRTHGLGQTILILMDSTRICL